MAASGFSRALKRVLVHEGGKVNDPRDPGGKTNQGVTQRVFSAWLRAVGKKERDVYTMTPAELQAIYKRRYWDAIGGDRLPAGIDYVVFDGAVNSGPAQSLKWLQRALGTRYVGKIDGSSGVMTLDAIADYPDHDKLVALICDRRLAFMQALRTWKTFGNGWSKRVANVRATGQAWAAGSVGPPVDYIPQAQAKANIEDAKPLPVMVAADMTSGTGGATATLAQGIEQARDQLQAFWYSEFVSKILVGLTIAGITLFVGGMGYRWYAARRTAKLKDALDLEAAPVRADLVESVP